MTEDEWGDQYKSIVELLRLRAGLFLNPSGRDTFEQTIRQTMQSAGYSEPMDYLRFLKADAKAFDDLLVATTIGESCFFRDAGQFRIISDLILPDIRRRRGPGHSIRVWSAGCAAGEEAYSMAMMLHRSGALSNAMVLGTDIAKEALTRARRAVYRESSLRGQDAEMAKSYLTEKQGEHHVNATIKKSVRIEHLNLALDNYPSTASGTRGMDLIMCRNVLIYFDEPTIQSVVARLFRSLADGGWLITAPSDPPIYQYDLFDFVPTDDGLAYRKANLTLGDRPAVEPLSAGAAVVKPSATVPRVERRDRSKIATPSRYKLLAEARQALDDGDFQRAADLTSDVRGEGAVIHIKALANIDVPLAAKACAAAMDRRPLSQELRYLYSILLMDMDRHQEAAESLRRVLYLDGSLAVAHFSLGTALRTLGDMDGALAPFARRWRFAIAHPGISRFRSVTTKR